MTRNNQLKIYLIKNFDPCLVINSKHMNSLFQKLIILQKERIKVLQKRRIIHTLNYRLVLNIWQLCVQNVFQKPNLPLLSRSICIHVETRQCAG